MVLRTVHLGSTYWSCDHKPSGLDHVAVLLTNLRCYPEHCASVHYVATRYAVSPIQTPDPKPIFYKRPLQEACAFKISSDGSFQNAPHTCPGSANPWGLWMYWRPLRGVVHSTDRPLAGIPINATIGQELQALTVRQPLKSLVWENPTHQTLSPKP